MISESKSVKNSGVTRGAGLAARPRVSPFWDDTICFFLFSFETENPLIGRQKPFSSCHYILSNRKPIRFKAKTFFFLIFYLVFIYFSANKGCHHEIPPRVPPLLATPLVKKFLWKALFHRKFFSTFLLILTQI